MMLNPPPSERDLSEIYEAQYSLLAENEESRRRFWLMKQMTARYYLDLVGRYRSGHSGALLEIGCGHGDFLLMAANMGYQVTGVEYSGHARAIARERLNGHRTVVHGEVREVRHLGGTFDVCVLSDVIEHVCDPRAFLEDIHRLLKPGGMLFVATPALDSWSARLLKQAWMAFKPEHIHYFNRNTLHSLLFQTGYEHVVGLPGSKFLNPDYIAGHFERYLIPKVSSAVRFARALRNRHLGLGAGVMIAIGTARTVPARRKVSIVLPAYNESATLETVLRALLEKDLEPLDKEIVLVESNSTDGTREIALKYQHHPQVRLVLEDHARGKGHAVRTGLAHATGDFILIQDADLEYDFEDYEVLLEPLLHGRQAFVLGSRHGGKIWKLRSFKGQWGVSKLLNTGHWVFRTLVNVFYGLKLKDPFTMYKVFRRDCLTGLSFECNHFDFDYELLIKLVRNGYTPVEIPVNYRSRSFAEGKKVSLWRDPWTWVRAIVRFRFTRLDILANARKQIAAVESRTQVMVGGTRNQAILATSEKALPGN
jgi:glycosyltransferase involved in cell wall biosynthesis/2-polyprenyl-3-methyl-5-hydroxy-6-metoxy-1,4-benzoquinol methylase